MTQIQCYSLSQNSQNPNEHFSIPEHQKSSFGRFIQLKNDDQRILRLWIRKMFGQARF